MARLSCISPTIASRFTHVFTASAQLDYRPAGVRGQRLPTTFDSGDAPLMLAALFNVPANLGYPVLFALVAGESAGALIPGETALILAGALASQGKLSLPLVIVVAAGAAIIGDNVGYLIGRKGLRRLVNRPGRLAAGRRLLLERGDEFFRRWGAAAVFFARWLPGLRVVMAWLAGANRMPWPRFLVWNALGGIAWATTIGGLAYLLGRSASGSLAAIGFVGIVLAVLASLIAHARRVREHRRARDDLTP